jgi:hypothetical protein
MIVPELAKKRRLSQRPERHVGEAGQSRVVSAAASGDANAGDDKWQLYRSAVRRYGMGECAAHFEALRSGVRAIDGIDAMLRRVVETADQPCLGIGSIYLSGARVRGQLGPDARNAMGIGRQSLYAAFGEFGASRPDLTEINAPLARALRNAVAGRVRDAQREGDVASDLDPETVALFLIANTIAPSSAASASNSRGLAISPIWRLRNDCSRIAFDTRARHYFCTFLPASFP